MGCPDCQSYINRIKKLEQDADDGYCGNCIDLQCEVDGLESIVKELESDLGSLGDIDELKRLLIQLVDYWRRYEIYSNVDKRDPDVRDLEGVIDALGMKANEM